MAHPAAANGPYSYRLSQVVMDVETVYGQSAVEKVAVALVGTIDSVNLDFQIPNSEDPDSQVVINDILAYADGVLDGAATFTEGTGGGGEDEVHFSVAPTLSATVDIVQGQPLNLGNLRIQAQKQDVSRVAYNKGLDLPSPIPTQREWITSFDMPWMNGGIAGVPPPIGVLLQACGFSETITPGTKVVYELLNSDLPSASFLCYMGNQIRRALGVRGTFTAKFTSGQPGTVSGTLNSPFSIPVDRGYPQGLVDPTNEEPIVELADVSFGPTALAATQINNGGGYTSVATVLTVDSSTGLAAGNLVHVSGFHEIMKIVSVDSGTQITVSRGHRGTVAVALADNQALQQLYKPCGDEFSLDLGNTLAKDLCYNATGGIAGELITQREAKGVLQVRATTEAERAYWSDYVTGQTYNFGFVIGQSAGKRVALYAPKARLTVPDDVAVNENYSLNLALSFQPDGSQPALTITFY